MKALGLVVLEKKIFLYFSHDTPRAGPQGHGWQDHYTIKRTTIHCYIHNMKALGLVVSEKKIFSCFSHCMSMGADDPLGSGIFYTRGMVGRIYIEDHYTMLHTKLQTMNA